MKKRTLLILTAVFSIILLVYACRRDLDNIIKDQEVPALALETVKIWYSKNTKDFSGINDSKFIRLKPLWRESWNIKTSGGNSLLIVPTVEKYLVNDKYKIRRVFVFALKKDQVSTGNIIEFVGENYDVTENINHLILNYFKDEIPGFTGGIMIYDVNYFKLFNTVFKKGAKTKDKLSFIRISNSEKNNSRKKTFSSQRKVSTIMTAPLTIFIAHTMTLLVIFIWRSLNTYRIPALPLAVVVGMVKDQEVLRAVVSMGGTGFIICPV